MRAGDWPKFRQLRLEALRESPLAFLERYDESAKAPDEFWIDRVERAATGSDRAQFAAFTQAGDGADCRMIAKATCFLEEEMGRRSVYLVGVYTTPSARGSGVSAQVLRALIDWAQANLSPDVIRLHVTEGNDRALAFYQRMGFVVTGETVPYPPDPRLAELEMVMKMVTP